MGAWRRTNVPKSSVKPAEVIAWARAWRPGGRGRAGDGDPGAGGSGWGRGCPGGAVEEAKTLRMGSSVAPLSSKLRMLQRHEFKGDEGARW